jgi:phosphoribosylformimino-5-aminoimidazole carboxamide ribonucleotide (ProFAR) isomerase
LIIKIEVGGGVRNIDSIKKYVDSGGVEKVILG